jgi:phage/conjugal plasmid C-4 type zinc finger TraR family protein
MLNEYALELSQVRAENEKNASIAATLARTGSADCDDCGRAIPEARRAAYPAARRCVSCQEQAEREAYTR